MWLDRSTLRREASLLEAKFGCKSSYFAVQEPALAVNYQNND